MNYRLLYFSALCLCVPYTVVADQHIDQFATVIDSQFKDYAENLSAAQSHKALTQSDSGALALDVGFEIATTKIERDSFLKSYTSKTSPNILETPKLHVSTGYGKGLNAGAFYSSVPDSDIQIYGGELRYSLKPHQRSALPAHRQVRRWLGQG